MYLSPSFNCFIWEIHVYVPETCLPLAFLVLHVHQSVQTTTHERPLRDLVVVAVSEDSSLERLTGEEEIDEAKNPRSPRVGTPGIQVLVEACFLWETWRALQRGSCHECEVGHLLQAVRPSANPCGGDGLRCWVLLSSGHSSVLLRGFQLDSED